ncbi:jg13732 [Pararge aegeria aegeria]|uniref:Jg13732 protein n=1 Tax=Pararge aegeria aegeria TaxID=348720 RepID=A0A8S4RNP5_9NEOP|nr:jg13732 [Pararge aegeria aegeria]
MCGAFRSQNRRGTKILEWTFGSRMIAARRERYKTVALKTLCKIPSRGYLSVDMMITTGTGELAHRMQS